MFKKILNVNCVCKSFILDAWRRPECVSGIPNIVKNKCLESEYYKWLKTKTKKLKLSSPQSLLLSCL